MSFMKMASMASASIVIVLVFVMLDSAIPETFIRLFVVGFLLAGTGFLGYRLMLAFNMIQEQGKTQPVPQNTLYGVYALGIITLVFGATALYILFNPVMGIGVMSASGLTILLVFIVTRSILHIDIFPLLGLDDDQRQ